ncbi:MAG TPA: hypothetical protein DCZ10_02100 [Pelotomaculum sp.]|nr:hypothetical protein [Pelotomaculum sp.]
MFPKKESARKRLDRRAMVVMGAANTLVRSEARAGRQNRFEGRVGNRWPLVVYPEQMLRKALRTTKKHGKQKI